LEKELNIFIPQFEQQIPINFLSLEEETFYNYLKEVELKYYSKLIPRPLTLILHHNLTKEERDLFKSDLFHVINFRYWGDNLKADMSDNFKQVYREWHKEL
jgi:predicted metal-dependent phosphoesterase TrpH